MSTYSELEVCERWLDTTLDDATLTGLAPGGNWSDLAPEDSALTVVVWQLQAPGQDIQVVDGQTIMVRFLLTIRAIAEGRARPRTAANRIHTLLHRQSGAVGVYGRIESCQRRQIVGYPEVTEGREYRHQGGIYEINVTAN